MKKKIKYLNTKLNNNDLDILNKNIIALILQLKNNEKHLSRIDYDLRMIKEKSQLGEYSYAKN